MKRKLKMPQNFGDYTQTLDAVIARSVELDQQGNPDIQNLKHCVLKNGPLAYKYAKYWTVVNRHTHELHHHGLTIETVYRTKTKGWELKDKNVISLDDENGDQIQRLFDFLATTSHVKGDGEYTIIRQDDERVSRIIDAISSTGQRQELLGQILDWVDSQPTATEGLIELSREEPERARSLIAALNYGRYSRALQEFRRLIDDNETERIYQQFLESNYWIFGSEYSELLPNRILTVGDQLDFPLRRTVDGYIEVIEIKRPTPDAPLFIGSTRLHPRSEVSEAVAQAQGYLEQLDKDHYRILAEFGIEVSKARAIVVIGRDGDKKQQDALRLHNAGLTRVEVITFDQLSKIAERILKIIAKESSQVNLPAFEIDDIPF